jgi:hypothetical protein
MKRGWRTSQCATPTLFGYAPRVYANAEETPAGVVTVIAAEPAEPAGTVA